MVFTAPRFSHKLLLFVSILLLRVGIVSGQSGDAFRPPAVPLVTHDPYFSIWSMGDRLTDDWTKHWTEANQPIDGMLRIDGTAYRFMGPRPKEVPAMEQTGLEVRPTTTVYRFEAGGVHLDLTFTTPTLPEDLDLLSRPVSYITWDVQASDARTHDVALYFDATALLAVNSGRQEASLSRFDLDGLRVLRAGSQEQAVLARAGDDLRIDWGYFYLAVPSQGEQSDRLVGSRAARRSFAETGALPASDDLNMPRAAGDGPLALAVAFDLGQVGAAPLSRHVLLAYDDQYAIEYFHRRLRPYWQRNGMDMSDLLQKAAADYKSLMDRSRAFDAELTRDLTEAGGQEYARLAALAFRQTLAAHKLVADIDGTPMLFAKENFSNGCIGTVDVAYPSSPFFLLFNPTLLQALLEPVMRYAQLPRWPFPFAPHDLGTYPLANGQVYGGREESEENQMPVEESGNMLIMTAALAQAEGNASFAQKYWPLLEQWAAYLLEKGMDPENQLSTDDFAGHLAHNTNLSIKAIVALGSFSRLAEMLGRKDEARLYRAKAEDMARRWVQMADDGDHFRLAFDKPGTWSQKYNLVWDDLLSLDLFPDAVARKEIAFYKTRQNEYGLPLDNRETYTKLDWIVWTATLAETPEDFRAFIAPAYAFADQSPSRVPLTDWYRTTNAEQVGFQARSVVGGVYIKMLSEPETWRKWSSRALATSSMR
ncbi:MAG TPA: DUF4965 domain-containing protein [Rhodothermales bacterium]|nr:DUF4965 domain-containing protein [Rhodothermales bacterium]